MSTVTWLKYPLSLQKQARTIKLRRAIGDAAYWVPVALWCFAAQQDTEGDLSAYKPAEIAEAIGYRGDARRLRRLLVPDFIDQAGCVVGWDELFRLAESRKGAAAKGAEGRWKKPAVSPTPPSERPEENGSEESVSGLDGDALRDGMRDALPEAATHTHTNASLFSLTDSICSDLSKEFGITAEGVTEARRIFGENKVNYKCDPQTLEAFRGWLRTSRVGKKMVKRFCVIRSSSVRRGENLPTLPEPRGWREWLNERSPDSPYSKGGEREDVTWGQLDEAAQTFITDGIDQDQDRQTAGKHASAFGGESKPWHHVTTPQRITKPKIYEEA